MPDIIHELSPHVADLIAAGEVVERPASVVKELCENSADAGARSIAVEITHGGATFIRVTDDGAGMSANDAALAFRRHATSKIRSEGDLDAIGTMGFRGEALAAIASVSRVDLMTREKNSVEGCHISLDAGEVTVSEPAGCPTGTTLLVRDLFFNTPARQKYLKKDAYEAAAVTAELQRQAMAHPEISYELIRDGRRAFKTAGDGDLAACVYEVLGREFALSLMKVSSERGGMTLSGFVGKPEAARANRLGQFFFVNGRPIRSSGLSQALENGFESYIMKDRRPICVIHIAMSPRALDVNVHPTKAEVRFASDSEVYNLVYYAAMAAAMGGTERPEIKKYPPRPEAPAPSPLQPPPLQPSLRQERHDPASVGKYLEMLRRLGEEPPRPESPRPPEPPALRERLESPAPQKQAPPAAVLPSPGEPPWRLVGEVLNTYIVLEVENAVWFIDKHAAHERLIFERLKAGGGASPMSQRLLSPVIFSGSARETQMLLDNAALTAAAGFELEPFGKNCLSVRSAPSGLDADDIPVVLGEMAGELTSGKSAGFESMTERLLYSVACKAAIKAGKSSDPAELRALAREVVTRSDLRYCPHGRPVTLIFTRDSLGREFRRLV